MLYLDMPGRRAAQRVNQGESVDKYISLPSKMGVLKFDNLDDGLDAIAELSDPDVLADIATRRDFASNENPASVKEGAKETTAIDPETIIGTSETF